MRKCCLIFYETHGLNCLRVADLRDEPPELDGVPTPLLLLSAAGDLLTLGPLYVPGSGVCAACACHWARTAGWERPAAPAPSSHALEILAAMTAYLATELHRGALPGELLRTMWEIEADTGAAANTPCSPAPAVHGAALLNAKSFHSACIAVL